MKAHRTAWIVAGLVCCGGIAFGMWAVLQTADPEPPKPVRDHPQWIDFLWPPDDVSQMVDAASAVVIARYDGVHRVTQQAEGDFIWTTYMLSVEEAIKDHSDLPSTSIELRLPGGEVEHPTHVERARTAGVAALFPGRRYLVFFNYHAASDRWFGAWGPASAYDISSDRVGLVATEVRRQAGRSVDEMLSEVRSAAGR